MTESPPSPDSGKQAHPSDDPAGYLNHHHPRNPRHLPQSLWRVNLALAFFTLLIIAALIYALFTGFRLTGKHASRIAAANDIKLLATTAHLWFEEILQGDQSQNMEDDVWANLRNADMYAEFLLEGGTGPVGYIFPLEDQAARKNMAQVRVKLAEFGEITNRRWEASHAAAGTEIDQQYDAMFAELMQIVDEVQTHVQRLVARDITRFKINMVALLMLVTIGGIASGLVITTYFRQSRRATQALHKSEVHNRTIVESALDCIITMDHAGCITAFNSAAEHTFGYPRHQVLGKDLAEIIIPERFRKSHHEGLQRYLRTGSSALLGRHIEMTALRHDGAEFPIELTINTSGHADHPIFTGFLRDITERKQARQLLEQSNRELAEKNLEMEQFVYIASHDLKSPLVTIQGFLVHLQRCLASGRIDPMPGYLGHIEQATLRLHDTIEVLLELSRIGRIISKPEPVDLNQVIGTLLEEYRDRLREMVVSIEVAEDLPIIMADPKRMTQVFDNLLVNAFKYACDGAHSVIHIEVEYSENGVRVIVADEGPGIPEKDHEKIFRIFERLQSGSEGAGIGLAIVKKIVETIGGKVWVESSRSGGAAFHLSFPKDIIMPQSVTNNQ